MFYTAVVQKWLIPLPTIYAQFYQGGTWKFTSLLKIFKMGEVNMVISARVFVYGVKLEGVLWKQTGDNNDD